MDSAGDFWEFSTPNVQNICLQRLLAMRKARIWRAFLIKERKFSEIRNAWLGREDSNLRMVESKSGYSTNDFNAYSEKDRKFVPRRISSLAADSE